MSHRNIPAEPHALLGYSRLIETTAQANQKTDQWDLDARRILALKAVNDHLELALQANDAKETRNHFTVVAKDEAVSALLVILRGFINYLIGKTDKITDEILQQLGIPPRHHVKHEPLPPPTDAPVVVIHTGHNHDADFYFFNNQAGHPTKYLAAANCHAVLLKYRLQGTDDWQQQTITRKHLTKHFGLEAQGKALEAVAAWLSPTLQPGPWSDPETAIVT
ncbi:MAG: hypothetical protein LBK76_05090 [Verrucomicrobiales bacterium]|jgi:hypothetical protein|nr:hypothetical protein [Verrucomicrobiales bacterium]